MAATGAAQAKQADCSSASSAFAQMRAKADLEQKAGRTDQVVRLLAKAHASCPDDYGNSVDLIKAQITAGNQEDADHLARSLLLRRDTAELHFLLGTIAAVQKNTRDAAAQFQTAATMDSSEDNLFALGTTLIRLDFIAATTVLQYGLKMYPASVKMHVALALALYAQDRGEEGALLLLRASDLDPSDVHPMEVLADTGIVPPSVRPAAERQFADLRRRYPADGLILFDEAMVRSGRWSGEQAAPLGDLMDEIKAALKLDPHLSKAFFELGVLCDESKDFRGEISALKSAIELNPRVERYHFRLAFAYRQAGDLDAFKRELAIYEDLHRQATQRPAS